MPRDSNFRYFDRFFLLLKQTSQNGSHSIRQEKMCSSQNQLLWIHSFKAQVGEMRRRGCSCYENLTFFSWIQYFFHIWFSLWYFAWFFTSSHKAFIQNKYTPCHHRQSSATNIDKHFVECCHHASGLFCKGHQALGKREKHTRLMQYPLNGWFPNDVRAIAKLL